MTLLSACCSLASWSAHKGGDGGSTTVREEPADDKPVVEQSDEEDSEDDHDTDDGGSPSQSEAGEGGGEDDGRGRNQGRRRSSLSVRGIYLPQRMGKVNIGEKKCKMSSLRTLPWCEKSRKLPKQIPHSFVYHRVA